MTALLDGNLFVWPSGNLPLVSVVVIGQAKSARRF